jgi:sugar phosphate isomerase/epimerase
MGNTSEPQDAFGIDLVAFFHPDFWGVGGPAEVAAKAEADPLGFWEKVLDAVTAAGITSIELTFPPGDWRSAVRAYGSARNFAQALADRGVRVVSGFFVDLARYHGEIPEEDIPHILDSAAEYADFLRTCGAEIMVVSLPMRRSWDAPDPFFVDRHTVGRMADVLNRLGHRTLLGGVRVALHNEAHSMFCLSNDLDLFMLFTDPVYVWLCADTGHLRLSGADPVHVVDRHRDRLLLAHFKDAIGSSPVHLPIDENIHADHRTHFRRVGAGGVDWLAWGRLLNDIGYQGDTLLELAPVPDPVADMAEARRYISTLAHALRSRGPKRTKEASS